MEKVNEIKLPKGVGRIAVKQHDDRIVIEFIPEEPKFKRGDILISIVTPGLTVIFDKITSTKTFDSIYHNGESSNHGWRLECFRHATEEEKQEFFDELKADGKRWNAEKKCIEDIPKRRFKVGDKVVLKSGYKKQDGLKYLADFDRFIGRPLTIGGYTEIGSVYFYDCPYFFDEDWLEPCEELKKGDLAIFWDNGYGDGAAIRLYDKKGHEYHHDSYGTFWENAIKFESKEQYEKILRGEI